MFATSGGNAALYPAPPVGASFTIAHNCCLLIPFKHNAIPATVGFKSACAYSMKNSLRRFSTASTSVRSMSFMLKIAMLTCIILVLSPGSRSYPFIPMTGELPPLGFPFFFFGFVSFSTGTTSAFSSGIVVAETVSSLVVAVPLPSNSSMFIVKVSFLILILITVVEVVENQILR